MYNKEGTDIAPSHTPTTSFPYRGRPDPLSPLEEDGVAGLLMPFEAPNRLLSDGGPPTDEPPVPFRPSPMSGPETPTWASGEWRCFFFFLSFFFLRLSFSSSCRFCFLCFFSCSRLPIRSATLEPSEWWPPMPPGPPPSRTSPCSPVWRLCLCFLRGNV